MATGHSSKASKVSKKREKKKATSVASKTSKRRACSKPTKGKNRTLKLDGRLCIEEIGGQRGSRVKTSEVSVPIVVDASGVEICISAQNSRKVAKAGKKRGSKKSVSATTRIAKRSRPKMRAKSRKRNIVLNSELSITDIGQLKEILTAALEIEGPLVIDGSAIESADTAALQLLTAFVIVARRRPGSLEWKATSPALQESARMLDLHQHLAIECKQVGGETDGLCPVF